MTINTYTNPTDQIEIDAGYETSKFALGVGIISAALIGLWGTACLISALADNGPADLFRSYLSALVG